MYTRLVMLLLLVIGLFGCGNGDTSGSLSLAAPTAVNYTVNAVATYTPASGSALPGQEIEFTWYTMPTGGVATQAVHVTGYTDSKGVASSQYIFPTPPAVATYVYVSAKTGNLSNKEGYQSVLVTP